MWIKSIGTQYGTLEKRPRTKAWQCPSGLISTHTHCASGARGAFRAFERLICRRKKPKLVAEAGKHLGEAFAQRPKGPYQIECRGIPGHTLWRGSPRHTLSKSGVASFKSWLVIFDSALSTPCQKALGGSNDCGLVRRSLEWSRQPPLSLVDWLGERLRRVSLRDSKWKPEEWSIESECPQPNLGHRIQHVTPTPGAKYETD